MRVDRRKLHEHFVFYLVLRLSKRIKFADFLVKSIGSLVIEPEEVIEFAPNLVRFGVQFKVNKIFVKI